MAKIAVSIFRSDITAFLILLHFAYDKYVIQHHLAKFWLNGTFNLKNILTTSQIIAIHDLKLPK